MDLFKITPVKNPNDYYGHDGSKPSIAVVASDGSGNGCLLFWAGGHLALEVEEYGFTQLSDLGLDDCPAGIWIWEGKYVWSSGYNHGMGIDEGGDASPVGGFRAPSELEWKFIRAGKSPWNREDWLLKVVHHE